MGDSIKVKPVIRIFRMTGLILSRECMKKLTLND